MARKPCVVRVAVNNNFNCTEAEFAQLGEFAAAHPEKTFFVNSNINTPRLEALAGSPWKAVVTANPRLDPEPGAVRRISALGDRLAFARVKWLPGRPDIAAEALRITDTGAKVVLTAQRFNGKASRDQWAGSQAASWYRWARSRYRLEGKAAEAMETFADDNGLLVCDRKGLGCRGCGICAALAGERPGLPVKSLNLSTSGICGFNCPDCYAKTMSRFAVQTGQSPVRFDHIEANDKQAGRTAHIRDNLGKEPTP